MTVTSVPAPLAPVEPATTDVSVAADNGAADGGAGGGAFAALLAGLKGNGASTIPVTGTGRSTPADPNAPADPVTLALLAALAVTAPVDLRADADEATAPEPPASVPSGADANAANGTAEVPRLTTDVPERTDEPALPLAPTTTLAPTTLSLIHI